MELTTPALLFPAISLLMLAYTNRFVVLAQLVRDLYARYKQDPDYIYVGQIHNLRVRIVIIKYMQIFGAFSFLLCVAAMFLIFSGKISLANLIFGASLVMLLISLALLVFELHLSVNAINIQLNDFEVKSKKEN